MNLVPYRNSATIPPFFFRKLKNRVAAQTARDKKKAKMDELEIVVEQLRAEVNKQFIIRCMYKHSKLPYSLNRIFASQLKINILWLKMLDWLACKLEMV